MVQIPQPIPTTTTRPTLSGTASRLMVDTAVAEASTMSVPVTVVVVDESGVTKELLRMDGAPLVSVQTALNKAYAAAAIGIPPDVFYSAIESDGAAVAEFASRPGLALIAGGLPVIVDGRVAGAIGVAGAMTGAEDRRIGQAAIAAVTGRRLRCRTREHDPPSTPWCPLSRAGDGPVRASGQARSRGRV